MQDGSDDDNARPPFLMLNENPTAKSLPETGLRNESHDLGHGTAECVCIDGEDNTD